MFMGLDIMLPDPGEHTESITFGFSIHDGYFSTDFALKEEPISADADPSEYPDRITDYILREIKAYSTDHMSKFVAVGFRQAIQRFCPLLCSRLWSELDILPFVFPDAIASGNEDENESEANSSTCDEIADSLARKMIMFFGPKGLPRTAIGYRNKVEVDDDGFIHMVDIADYERSVSPQTWECFTKLAEELKTIRVNGHKGVRVAFFNATPQGGGVALMRHALIRLFRLFDLHVTWYVPKPNPSVFRITKNNHNIIQGVADPDLRLNDAQKEQFTKWIESNFERYWSSGPLDSEKPPGVDIAVMDDPQVVGLIPKAKAAGIKVIYRSHIEVRSDLIKQKGSPQEGVWDYLWNSGIKDADVFISHPVKGFVPDAVDIKKVGLMPAATDWLDGLNKELSRWDTFYYVGEFKKQCEEVKANKLVFPMRPYICQIARFDPSKGIPDVLESYRLLREMMDDDLPIRKIPQLVIAGHGAVDDPDGTVVYDQTVQTISSEKYASIASDIIVMRLGPSDQLLNCLLSNAAVVLQLSHREGFEVKVSEAVHKGKPIVAYRAGGIPLQVQHEKNGYLCDVGDTSAVAKHMYDLFLNEKLYKTLSEYALRSVSDEVHTVGNASAWLYLFTELAKGNTVRPEGGWVYDLMREEAGVPWTEGENRLPRESM
ncbi:trehalose synthase [Myxozyma melibiosi]|uniref:Trehalose synthase n=1 Tax=Myxozyma melibiosi TaxID=54550 RepID=A0ABR1F9F4_9ASCO